MSDTYTPVLEGTGQRLLINDPIYSEGFHHGRGPGEYGVITDPANGKKYLITGKPCDIETCHCDAWAVEITC